MFLKKKTPFIMGILNVTPDSFSDGGKYSNASAAKQAALEFAAQGADLIDIGGESTRPGALPIDEQEELCRVLPVLQALQKESLSISLDTSKARVVQEALKIRPIQLVNDITALRGDPKMAEVVAKNQIPLLLMHMQGTPRLMQKKPVYQDVVADILSFFEERIEFALKKGIKQILLDPGIGFGKSLEHNLTLLNHLEEFTSLGYPVIVGPSRKSFIGHALGNMAEDRIWGTAAAVAIAVFKGARGIRVHDVLQMQQVAQMADKIKNSP